MSDYLNPNPGTINFKVRKFSTLMTLRADLKDVCAQLEEARGTITSIDKALRDMLDLANQITMNRFFGDAFYIRVRACMAYNITRFELCGYVKKEVIPALTLLLKTYQKEIDSSSLTGFLSDLDPAELKEFLNSLDDSTLAILKAQAKKHGYQFK